MSKRAVSVLLLLIVASAVAVFQLGIESTVVIIGVLFGVITIIYLYIGDHSKSFLFFSLSFAAALTWLLLRGAPPSQVVALPGWALIIGSFFMWGKNKVRSVVLAGVGVAVLIFSQYVRVVLMGG